MTGSSTACVGTQSAGGSSMCVGRPLDLTPFAISVLERLNRHDFIPARVDHLDGDSIVLAFRKRQGGRALERIERFGVGARSEGLPDFFPCVLVGEEGLRDAETSAVIVRVQKPPRPLF